MPHSISTVLAVYKYGDNIVFRMHLINFD